MQMVNTPIESSRFLHLKHLSITITEVNSSPSYDYFSLVSFFDASPSLETFYLDVSYCYFCMGMSNNGGTIN
jgi:hypothetical protein